MQQLKWQKEIEMYRDFKNIFIFEEEIYDSHTYIFLMGVAYSIPINVIREFIK